MGRTASHDEPNVEEIVLKEINGRYVATGELLDSYQELKNDGSTACGLLDLLRRHTRSEHENKANKREPKDYSRARLGILVAERRSHSV